MKLSLAKLSDTLGVQVLAKATSTSGRWTALWCKHRVKGLPCFDVIFVRVDGLFDRHHWQMEAFIDTDYATAEEALKTLSRQRYDQAVAQLQSKQESEEKDEDSGLTIINPDGTEEDYTIN